MKSWRRDFQLNRKNMAAEMEVAANNLTILF